MEKHDISFRNFQSIYVSLARPLAALHLLTLAKTSLILSSLVRIEPVSRTSGPRLAYTGRHVRLERLP
jgi:hypothetical protein